MSYTARVSELLCPLDVAYADDRGPGTHYGEWVSLRDYHRVWFLLDVGDMANLSTVNAGLIQATDTAGTGAKAIVGKTITALTQAGGDQSSLVCIELQTEELDVDGGFDCVRFYVVTAVNTVIYGAYLFGVISRYKPVPTTEWQEIVG